jgi:hypothetical protein
MILSNSFLDDSSGVSESVSIVIQGLMGSSKEDDEPVKFLISPA